MWRHLQVATKGLCDRPFALHCQQLEKDKPIVDVAPGKNSAGALGYNVS